MNWAIGLALLTMLPALLTSTYLGHVTDSAARSGPAFVWQATPVASPWPPADRWSYRDAQQHTAATLRAAELEQDWCERDPQAEVLRLQLAAANDVDTVWHGVRIPVSDGDLAAVQMIAEATAAERGMTFAELPQFWLVSRTELRRWGCLSETISAIREAEASDEPESTLGDPADRLNRLLGLRDPALTDAIRRQLRITLWGGWYTEPDDEADDGVGNVYLVTRAPIPIEMIDTISHELLHALQDQQLGWNLHETFLDPQTSDELTARRWVIEGDASANELTRYSRVLRGLLATHTWGPYSGLEFDLARRAYRVLSPLEATATFAPYEDGAAVVARIAREVGLEAVNELLHDPPPSTEQLMHAEKLAANEPPIQLDDLDALREHLLPPTRWQDPIVDRMGEHWLRTLLVSATGDAERSSAAAAGWGSDQIALWQSIDDEQASVVTMQFVFDDAEQHRQGTRGLLAWLVAHSDDEARRAIGRPVVGWDGPAGIVRLIIRPDSVWLVAASDTDTANQLAHGLTDIDLTDYRHE